MTRWQAAALAGIAALFLFGLLYMERLAHPVRPATVPANQRGAK